MPPSTRITLRLLEAARDLEEEEAHRQDQAEAQLSAVEDRLLASEHEKSELQLLAVWVRKERDALRDENGALQRALDAREAEVRQLRAAVGRESVSAPAPGPANARALARELVQTRFALASLAGAAAAANPAGGARTSGGGARAAAAAAASRSGAPIDAEAYKENAPPGETLGEPTGLAKASATAGAAPTAGGSSSGEGASGARAEGLCALASALAPLGLAALLDAAGAGDADRVLALLDPAPILTSAVRPGSAPTTNGAAARGATSGEEPWRSPASSCSASGSTPSDASGTPRPPESFPDGVDGGAGGESDAARASANVLHLAPLDESLALALLRLLLADAGGNAKGAANGSARGAAFDSPANSSASALPGDGNRTGAGGTELPRAMADAATALVAFGADVNRTLGSERDGGDGECAPQEDIDAVVGVARRAARQAGAPPNAVGASSTVLHVLVAARASGAALAAALALGAVVDRVDGDERTALHVAALCSNAEAATLLLRHGALRPQPGRARLARPSDPRAPRERRPRPRALSAGAHAHTHACRQTSAPFPLFFPRRRSIAAAARWERSDRRASCH